jgi:uncharacterized membrane protein YeiH
MILLNSFEIIGTIAFAISGALAAIEKKLDLFGIIFLAITTSVGGGIFRDIIMGNTPPTAFVDPSACMISIITALIVFFFYEIINKLENIIVVSDALGLGVFTVIGCRTAVLHGANNAFMVIAMGLITGVGGGMLRDVFAKNIPTVLKKEIYALASIIGGLVYYYTHSYFSDIISLFICCAIIFLIRILSVIYNVNLPIPEFNTNNNSV